MQLEGLAFQLTATRVPNQMDRYQNIGAGGIDVEKNYDLIMNKWEYGNFDKVDTYVNTSYTPAIQSMRGTMLRTMDALMQQGDSERAMEIGDKYFQSFPNMNFPFYYEAFTMLEPYFQAGAIDRVNDVIVQIAENTAERLRFYESLDPGIVAQSSYTFEQRQGQFIAQRLLLQLQQSDNTELRDRVQGILQHYLYLAEPQEQTPG